MSRASPGLSSTNSRLIGVSTMVRSATLRLARPYCKHATNIYPGNTLLRPDFQEGATQFCWGQPLTSLPPFHEPLDSRTGWKPVPLHRSGLWSQCVHPAEHCSALRFMAPVRDARIVEAFHEPGFRSSRREEAQTSAATVQVLSVRSGLEVGAPHEPR